MKCMSAGNLESSHIVEHDSRSKHSPVYVLLVQSRHSIYKPNRVGKRYIPPPPQLERMELQKRNPSPAIFGWEKGGRPLFSGAGNGRKPMEEKTTE